MNETVLYIDPQGQVQLDVQYENETFWLPLNDLCILFERDKSVISRHLKKIFKEGELLKESVVAKNATTAGDGKTYQVEFYNLDAILSVGYRVNSKRGTQFRQWATQRLKDYLTNGYAINQKRLDQLQQVVQLISKGGNSHDLQLQEAKGLLDILSNYTQSFILLNQFDSQSLTIDNLNENVTYIIHYEEAIEAIAEHKKKMIL